MTVLIVSLCLTLPVVSAAPPKSLTAGDAEYQDGDITQGLQSFKVSCQDCFRSYGEVAFIKISKNEYKTSSRNPRIKMKTEATVYLDPCQDHELVVQATMQSGAKKVKILYYKKEACPAENSKGSSNCVWPS